MVTMSVRNYNGIETREIDIWGVYGFHDAINVGAGWVSPVYLGLNQAPIVVMIENHRTGLLWDMFMANEEIPAAVKRIGFVAEGTVTLSPERGDNGR